MMTLQQQSNPISAMLILRWLLGIGLALALTVFVLILTVGKGIGSAYQSGASSEDLVRTLLTLAIPALLAAMLLSVFLPNARAYLHVVAAGVVLAMAGCASLLKSNSGEAALYLSGFGLWALYYGVSAWGKA